MNLLKIYATSRAMRDASQDSKQDDGFIPTFMRMDIFEQRAVLGDDLLQVDSLSRILLLREAANFSSFKALKFDLDLIKFFTKSDSIFKFFEELIAENVSFDNLAEADPYAEFSSHIEILEILFNNYKKLLYTKNLTDKMFIVLNHKLNMGFLDNYTNIEVYLEGYLSYYELRLLEHISQHINLKIHYTTSNFNKKMQERFVDIGIPLPNDAHILFDLSQKKVIESEPNSATLATKVYVVEERAEQIVAAFVEIDKMVKSGIEPSKIVLVLPDEKFMEQFLLYDKHHNLNFSMGYKYTNTYVYKILNALYGYWTAFDKDKLKLLFRYGLKVEDIESISSAKVAGIDSFFIHLQKLNLLPIESNENSNENSKTKIDNDVYDTYMYFKKIFETEKLTYKEWLFLWLKALSKISKDDINGGLITVMGVLETRGIEFDGVVVVDFNEGIVPSPSSKDQFLNSLVRVFAKLPTKYDRESLQKQYYKRVLERASSSVLIYASSDSLLPSKFLYELGLDAKIVSVRENLDLLYANSVELLEDVDPLVENFNAKDFTWSPSRLKIYLECKRKYYYRYISKIEQKNSEEFNEGLFLHKLFEYLYSVKSSYSSKDELKKELNRLMDNLLPSDDSMTKYRKLLWSKKLEGFVSSQVEHFEKEWRVVEREKEFHGEIGGLKFKGRIDRIDQNSTDTLVIDYKSGSIKDAQKTKNIDTLTDFQMSIYFYILQSKYQNIRLSFLKIFEGGEIEDITAFEEKNKRLESVIIELKQCSNFIATKCEDLQRCKWCEYILMCSRGDYL